jgi:hypothetical protein
MLLSVTAGQVQHISTGSVSLKVSRSQARRTYIIMGIGVPAECTCIQFCRGVVGYITTQA